MVTIKNGVRPLSRSVCVSVTPRPWHTVQTTIFEPFFIRARFRHVPQEVLLSFMQVPLLEQWGHSIFFG